MERRNRDSEPAGTDDAHMERLESWFGSHSQDWTEAYRVASRVNDHVLVDRLRIALTFVRRDVPPGGLILDAGCGAGWASLELARSGYSVHGVDLAQEMIDQAERTFVQEGLPGDAYRFTRGDVTQLELAPESFDGIIALGVLQYQVEEALLLQRFHELLRPGGTLVVTGPIERSIPNFFGVAGTAGSTLRRMRVLRSRPRTGRTLHRYSVTRLRRLLQAAGYEVVEQKGHGFGDWALIGRVIGYRGELALHRFFSWVATFTPVGRWGNDLVLVARRSAE